MADVWQPAATTPGHMGPGPAVGAHGDAVPAVWVMMNRVNPSPAPRQIQSWQVAEHNAAEWMRHWGFLDARVTESGSDQGIDVRASRALAQVKFEAKQVGRPQVQNLVGARGRDQAAALLFFSGVGFARPAVQFADEMEVALFTYSLLGAMTPANEAARRLIEDAEAAGQSESAPTRSPRQRHYDRMLSEVDDPETLRRGEVVFDPGDNVHFDYPYSITEIVQALKAIHSKGGGRRIDIDTQTGRVTITPDWIREYTGLISISADMETVKVRGERTVRLVWSTQSHATPANLEEATDDAHRAAERANNLLDHLLSTTPERTSRRRR